jgi:hypothetical protein
VWVFSVKSRRQTRNVARRYQERQQTMRIEIVYDADDEIEPTAAHLLADEIKASDQFGPYDTVKLRVRTWADSLS